MTTPTNVPPGWYPDTEVPGGQRWWDGIQWSEHRQPPAAAAAQGYQPYQPAAELTAPAGTDTNTVWIWLVALLPLLSLISLFAIDMSGYMRSLVQNSGSGGALSLLTSPGYLLTLVLGWGSTAVIIFSAYRDWRTLQARGVPNPFHWAFVFLTFVSAGIVYPIGRSVVVHRRAGGSRAPMYVAIAVYVAIIVGAIVWTVVITSQMLSMMPALVS